MICVLDEVKTLLSIIQSDEKSFEETKTDVLKHFKPEAYSKICLCLRCMLEDDYFLDTYGRRDRSQIAHYRETLSILFILHTLSATDGGNENALRKEPLPNSKIVLYDQLNKYDESEWVDEATNRIRNNVKYFIYLCLTGGFTADKMAKSPAAFLDLKVDNDMEFVSFRDNHQWKEKYHELLKEEVKSAVGGPLRTGITPAIVDKNEFHGGAPLTEPFSILRFEPFVERPLPPVLPIQNNELFFLHSDGFCSDLFFDCAPTASPLLDIRELLTKAGKQKFGSEAITQLTEMLKTGDWIISQCGLSIERIPDIVDNNYHFAEALYKSMSTSSCVDDRLYSVLIAEECRFERGGPAPHLEGVTVSTTIDFISFIVSRVQCLQSSAALGRLCRLIGAFLCTVLASESCPWTADHRNQLRYRSGNDILALFSLVPSHERITAAQSILRDAD